MYSPTPASPIPAARRSSSSSARCWRQALSRLRPRHPTHASCSPHLETFVLDVIRQARHSLHIGGAFWNDEGFELLGPVLTPALTARQVATTLYVNQPAPTYRHELTVRLAELQAAGPVTVRWFAGPRPTMLHAKFVIRDRRHDYLGTANLTSWGMQSHIEAGVELTAGQAERFVTFLEQLDTASLFADPHPKEPRLGADAEPD